MHEFAFLCDSVFLRAQGPADARFGLDGGLPGRQDGPA